ncbi:hypothetical protein K3495_g7190 [Podosphaera aphanis]|nr:hypothetical protein K3495_g7190 [Podosphaera aphanis]
MPSFNPITSPHNTAWNSVSSENKARLELTVAWILDPESIDLDTFKAPTPTQACVKHQLDTKRFRNLISSRITPSKNQTLNERAECNQHGGNNRVLRATKALVKSANDSFLAKQSHPRPLPLRRWFYFWYNTRKDTLKIHEIRRKPMAQACLESHSNEDIKE